MRLEAMCACHTSLDQASRAMIAAEQQESMWLCQRKALQNVNSSSNREISPS